ncbi:MAG: DNA polymerase I, partial [Chlamydiia bacterium]|nr:DNA polymerase I [Chlamydiia bacterium]
SQKLAHLYPDLKIPTDSDFYKMADCDHEKLSQFYRDKGFFSLLKEMGIKEEKQMSLFAEEELPEEKISKKGVKAAPKGKYHIVETIEELEKLAEKLSKEKELCLDAETTHLRPMQAQLVGVGLGIKAGEAWYIPLNGELGEDALEFLRPVLENDKISFYGHNIKYDLHVLMNAGIEVKSLCFDTLIASYLLAPQKNRHGLDQIILEHFNVIKTPISKLIGTGKKQKSMADVDISEVGSYCCEDVDYTCKLKALFEKELKSTGLEKLFFEVELPLVWVLLRMERAGIYIDKERLKQKSQMLAEKLKDLKKKIYKHAGKEFNINSPKQMSEILFTDLELKTVGRKKATGYSTSAAVLAELQGDHPIIDEIIDYRTIEKLRSTYVDSLPEQINPQTHRIHCSFHQSVTATGRLSCTDPNLQNIPIRTAEGKKVREAFTCEKRGVQFLSADYSQVELRILAHLTGDKTLIEAFKNGNDIHAATASSIFEVPLKDVSPDMRRKAKAVNFGIIYGQQAFGLSESLGMDFHDAEKFISTYFERHPKVKEFIEDCKAKARKTGVATSMTGRIRPLPEIKSKNPHLRAAAERYAVNTPIQGTQSDIIKMAMIAIDAELKDRPEWGQMILQIHDELLFEVPQEHLAKVKKIVVDKMETAFPLKVPLVVDVSVGKNWGECYN